MTSLSSSVDSLTTSASGTPITPGPRRQRRLRVAMVVTGFPTPDQPQRGIFNLRAARGLRELADVKVLFLRAWRPGRPLEAVETGGAMEISVPQLPLRRLLGTRLGVVVNMVLYRRLAWRRVRSLLEDCDVVYSVGAAPAGVVAGDWARRLARHHVVNANGSDVNSLLPRIRALVGVAGWENHVHGVVCQSHALRIAFQAMYPRVPNVTTLYRGVDLQAFKPIGEELGPLAGVAPVRFIYLGGFPSYVSLSSGSNTKGGWTLLAAWKAAEDSLSAQGASLIVAGPASSSEAVSRWRSQLRHPERVFLEGLVHPDRIPGYIRASDVMLVPSLEEGLPNSSIEASACARPVFGSDTGGIREVIVSGQTGLLLPPGDVGVWSKALAGHANQVGELGRMGALARVRMESHFDSRNYAPRVLDLFRAALELPRS